MAAIGCEGGESVFKDEAKVDLRGMIIFLVERVYFLIVEANESRR